MTYEPPKLAYVAAQFKIRVEISPRPSDAMNDFPWDLIERAKVKMESLLKSGDISSYRVYDNRLHQVWTKIRENNFPFDKKISFCLAEGCPKLPGVEFKLRLDGDKKTYTLSINAHKSQVAQWKPDWIEFFLNQELKEREESSTVSSAQVMGSYLRALSGESVQNSPILLMNQMAFNQEKPYSLVANHSRQEIYLIIKDLRLFLEHNPLETLLTMTQESLLKASKNYYILRKETTQQIFGFQGAYQTLGIDLPLVILMAVNVNPKNFFILDPKNQTTSQAPQPGKNKVKIRISQDAMSAEIMSISQDFYTDPDCPSDEHLVIEEAKRMGIVEKAYVDQIVHIKSRLHRKAPLDNLIIAQGQPGSGGKKPYILESYKKNKQKSTKNQKEDMRSQQQQNIVSQGQLIAEIAWEVPATSGWDIFGNDIPCGGNEQLELQLGEGVRRGTSNPNMFYAVWSGVPSIDSFRRKIFVMQDMIHEGDVNLKTGNIVFEGNVEIKGSVDTGAVVDVRGDLVIHGSVLGSKIRCKGNLVVEKGIVTGQKGHVLAKGSIYADFIENSIIHCSSDLTVNRSILNSQILCGGNIVLKDERIGILAGGYTSCQNSITTANFGFKVGSKTIVHAGVDAVIKKRLEIREKRFKAFKHLLENERKSLEELQSRRQHEKNTKLFDKKTFYEKRIKRLELLVPKLERQAAEASALLTYNPFSKIWIKQYAYSNVLVFIGDGEVTIPQDMAGVVFLAKKSGGKKVVSLEQAEKVLKKEAAAAET